MKCGEFCDVKDSYVAKFYHHYIFIYASNSLALFSIFIEIIISLQRIFFIKNDLSIQKWPINFIFALLLVISLILNLPNVIAAEIKPIWSMKNNATIYVREPKLFFKKKPWVKIIIGMLVGLRMILIFVLLIVLYILTYYFFVRHLKKKKKLKDAFYNRKNSLRYCIDKNKRALVKDANVQFNREENVTDFSLINSKEKNTGICFYKNVS